jgi:hypothetical protein
MAVKVADEVAGGADAAGVIGDEVGSEHPTSTHPAVASSAGAQCIPLW